MCNSTLLYFPHSDLSQSDIGSEKENPLSRRPSPCQPPAQFTCKDSGYEPAICTSTTTAANSYQTEIHHQAADRDLGADLSSASQSEEGEGWDREQSKRLEERNKWFEEGLPVNEMGSRWESMELKKGSVPVPVIETMDSEVNRKWVEFETMSFQDMSSQSLIGTQAYQSSTAQASASLLTPQRDHSPPQEVNQSVTGSQTDTSNMKEAPPSINGTQITMNTAEALQKEVGENFQFKKSDAQSQGKKIILLSNRDRDFSLFFPPPPSLPLHIFYKTIFQAVFLRKQVESIKKERAAMGIEVESPCGTGAPCRARLEAMEVAHRKALQELQEKHAKEIKKLEEEKDRMLQEESQAAAKGESRSINSNSSFS